MKNLKRGGFDMTDVLSLYNMQEIVGKKIESEKLTKNEKLNSIITVINVKKSKEIDSFIEKNIVFDPNIRDGKATIKGTRITPKELILATSELLNEKENQEVTFKMIKDYLCEQYPSITKKSQIEAAIYYLLKNEISLFKYIVATFINR